MKMEENVKIIQAYLGGWDETVPTGHLVMGLQFEGDGWGQVNGHTNLYVTAKKWGCL